MKINKHYSEISESYLFSTVAKKQREFSAAHPDREIIRLSIGDVTLPLAGAVVKAMHDAVDEMSTKEGFHGYGPEQGYEFFPIMAAIAYEVQPLLNRISELLTKLPPILRYEPEPKELPKEDSFSGHRVQITKQDGVYLVEGDWLPQLIRSVNFDDYESLQYFQRVLISSGVIDALREAGVQEGDTVSMYDLEFDFME